LLRELKTIDIEEEIGGMKTGRTFGQLNGSNPNSASGSCDKDPLTCDRQ
jgi:hypothetical protein